MKLLAIIPARGGSKGIPNKNLVEIDGRTLIAHAISVAKNSEYVTDIVISTDNDDIIEECKRNDVEVPFVRPVELATDTASMIDVVIHAMDWYESTTDNSNYIVVLLQPTSPFRNSKDIDQCYQLLNRQNAESVVSVHKLRESPYECIKHNGKTNTFLLNPAGASRRQDYSDNFYYINGVIYMAINSFLRSKKIFFDEKKTLLYDMNPLRGIDIDEKEDLILANALAQFQGFKTINQK